jgi:Na+-translocating ferredoxin:NAD+ oxidoreductase RnfA subunit
MYLPMAIIRLQNAAFLLAADTNTDSNPFDTMSSPIIKLLDQMLTPALSIFTALAAVYCVILGAKLAKAEEPQDREKAKNALKNAVIGFVMIFILLALLKVGMKAMTGWYNQVGTTTS